MDETALKHNIQDALQRCSRTDFPTNASRLFDTLGYRSDLSLDGINSPSEFLEAYDPLHRFNHTTSLLNEWQSITLLFQLTDDNIGLSGQHRLIFDDTHQIDDTRIESYLFIALDLRGADYTRTQLAMITREINRLFPMPAMILFRHGAKLTFSIIHRRLNKQDTNKDVLEKVTLIKDIACNNPHRAHIEILYDLSLARLLTLPDPPRSFVRLHQIWQEVLNSAELNKRFFQEIANWYFWASGRVIFPSGDVVQAAQKGKSVREDGITAGEAQSSKQETRNAIGLIRLITRLLFVWFLKEKGLAPDDLFDEVQIRKMLVSLEAEESTYYKAILQNLFFATLNQEMNIPTKAPKRAFRRDGQNYNATSLYRYRDLFRTPEEALERFADVPFLNGGLFECLDKVDEATGKVVRVDGFSDRPDNTISVPNELFFGTERKVDLNEIYATEGRSYRAQGLLRILRRYKFTVAENTPIEEEIALDPELLGHVFENLLASYNPETRGTARKQTGSFYTPREIVDYMVDEVLIAHLGTALTPGEATITTHDDSKVRQLLAYNDEPHSFTYPETERLIGAIDSCKIIDPACGSGAFPMGILHKLVFILGKLDPHNQRWKQKQITKAMEMDDAEARERAIAGIDEAFEHNELDYGRKLYLIENCIFGVDIQPIAVQIAKLRCFIALIVDQRVEPSRPNLGIRPLPNLESNFVAANSLIPIERPTQLTLRDPEVDRLEAKLGQVRKRHFAARTPRTKEQCREEDKQLRQQISILLRNSGFPSATADLLAQWNPYDQNASASFFDPEWMFGVMDGFAVVIGNPPYVRHEQIKELKPDLQRHYDCYTGTADLYVYFYERAFQLLETGGVLSYISSNRYFRSGYGEKLRKYLGAETTIEKLIDLEHASVFTAIAYPSIIVTRKGRPDDGQIRALNWEPGPPISEFTSVFARDSFLLARRELTADGWRLESPTVLRLLDKLRAAGTPLGEYVGQRFYRGILTGLNEAFVVDRVTRDRLIAAHSSSERVLKPFLRGRDVKRWQVEFADQYLIKIESSENNRHPWSGKEALEAEYIFAKTYPAIHARFQEVRAKLIKRSDQGQYFWELRSCAYWQAFEEPKIIYPDIYEHQSFVIDTSSTYIANTCYFIPTTETWLCGLLNSTTVEWFYSLVANKVRGGYLRAFSDYVRQIPIPSNLDYMPITTLVSQIIAAKHGDPNVDVSAWEEEIDERMYQLYGLTKEEIGIIREGVLSAG